MTQQSKIFERLQKTARPIQHRSAWSYIEERLSGPENARAESALFLKVLTTYVVRMFKNRRKRGVPVGKLDKFCLPDDAPIQLFETLATFVAGIMKKRGVTELKTQGSHEELSKPFQRLTPVEVKK